MKGQSDEGCMLQKIFFKSKSLPTVKVIGVSDIMSTFHTLNQTLHIIFTVKPIKHTAKIFFSDWLKKTNYSLPIAKANFLGRDIDTCVLCT